MRQFMLDAQYPDVEVTCDADQTRVFVWRMTPGQVRVTILFGGECRVFNVRRGKRGGIVEDRMART